MIFVGSVIIIMRRSVVLLAAVAVSIPGCDGHGYTVIRVCAACIQIGN